MLKFIFYVLLFYFIYKIFKLVKNYLSSSKEKVAPIKGNPPVESKFKNVEEADFKEIDPNSKNKNDSN